MMKKKGEFTVLRNIRLGILVILFVYIGLLFWSQGNSNVPFDEVKDAVVKAADDSNMTLAGTQDIKRLYGMNPKDYEDMILYYTNETMGVNELLLVKTNGESETEAVENAAEERKATQLDNFDGYGAEQVKLLNSSIIKTKGNYVLFVISPKAEEVEKAFSKSLQ